MIGIIEPPWYVIRMPGGVGFLLPTNMTIQWCANHHVRQFL